MTAELDCPQCSSGQLQNGVCKSCGLNMIQVCENVEARGRELSGIASQLKPILSGGPA